MSKEDKEEILNNKESIVLSINRKLSLRKWTDIPSEVITINKPTEVLLEITITSNSYLKEMNAKLKRKSK